MYKTVKHFFIGQAIRVVLIVVMLVLLAIQVLFAQKVTTATKEAVEAEYVVTPTASATIHFTNCFTGVKHNIYLLFRFTNESDVLLRDLSQCVNALPLMEPKATKLKVMIFQDPTNAGFQTKLYESSYLTTDLKGRFRVSPIPDLVFCGEFWLWLEYSCNDCIWPTPLYVIGEPVVNPNCWYSEDGDRLTWTPLRVSTATLRYYLNQ